jgi:catechol 2,3-dioxygenase-like lactoylglutathione lyase family enzyme
VNRSVPIQELFHLMLMVDDFDPAQQFFDDLFDPVMMFTKSWSDFDKRWASISLVGSDFSLELMEASKQEEDAGAPLPKFARRFGQHLHSLAWYVDVEDMPTLVDTLLDHDVRVVRPDGSRYVTGEFTEVTRTIFTHGRDTFGQIEFQARGAHDPRFSPGWSGERWRSQHPLGLERVSHITMLVRDVGRARELFVDALGGTLVHQEEDADDARSFVLVGPHTMLELLHPKQVDSPWGRELEANGELPNAITFLVRDLDAAEQHVKQVGAGLISRTEDAFTADPADTFNAVMTFTTRRIPGDPRDEPREP